MVRLDLIDAGINPLDENGEVLDFHGQRTTFITELARSGASPAVAQRLARHSDVNLTLKTYTKLQIEDLAGAVDKLPDLSPGRERLIQTIDEERPSDTLPDGDFAQLAAIWTELPDHIKHIKRAIMALIESAKDDKEP